MTMEYAKLIQKDFTSKRRVIAVSDLHGHYSLFKEWFKQLHFSKDDALIIVGDLLEKGSDSLELLRFIMELQSDYPDIYCLKGNNDLLLPEFMEGKIGDDDLLGYLERVDGSIFKDIANESSLKLETKNDIECLKEIISSNYQKELEFLKDLPHILDCDKATFVHAGLKPGPLNEQEVDFVTEAKAFSESGYRFEKTVVVGHWPASNYSKRVIDVNIHFNKECNIISIDGGLGLKGWGQLNVLIFENNTMRFEVFEDLPLVTALEAQEESKDPLTLIFPYTEVEILEKGETESRCFVKAIQREMVFKNELLYFYKGATYCFDFTTYHFRVEAGDCLRKCHEDESGIFYKKNGIVGHYKGNVR